MKRLLLSTIAMLFIATGFVTYVSFTENQDLFANFDEYEVKGIYKSLVYFHEKLADENGEIKDEYILQARRDVKAFKETSAKNDAPILQWEEMGPNNVGGRTRALVIDKDDPNLIYAGSVTGGLWISRNGADTWEEYVHNRELPVMSVGTMDQASDGTIWWTSGEPSHGDGGGSYGGFMPGEGVFKLSGPDDMFEQIASTIPVNPNNNTAEWARLNRIDLHPDDPQKAFVATDGDGLLRTENGGNNWITPTGLPGNGVCFDVEIGSNASIGYTAINENIYRTTNGGNTWEEVTALNLISDRKEIAISPSDNNYAYITYASSSGKFVQCVQTTDGGSTWNVIGSYDEDFLDPFTVAPNTFQGWYDQTIAVDPANPERIFVGGVSFWSWSQQAGWRKLDNFGSSILNPFYIHADKHVITFDNNDPNRMFVGGDGGVFRTTNAGSDNPFFLPRNKNYNVTQFYAVGAGLDGRITAGAQDNGTSYLDYRGTSVRSANLIAGGDGGFTEISDISNNIIFASTQNGNFFRSPNFGDSFGGFLDANCETATFLGNSLFIAPFKLWEDLEQYLQTQNNADPIKRSKIFSGGRQIFCGFDPLNASGVVVCQGAAPGYNGLIADFGVSAGVLSALDITSDGDILWAASSSGRLVRVKGLDEEGNQPGWEYDMNGDINSFNRPQFTSNFDSNPWGAGTVSSIGTNPESKQEVVLTITNFNQADNIYICENAQLTNPTWTSIQADLPPMPIYSAIFDPTDDNRIIAGTELGIWIYDRITNTWTDESEGIGPVRTLMVRAEPMNDIDCPVIYVATHGRGVFRAANLASDMGCDVSLPDPVGITEESSLIAESSVAVYPNPMVSNATVKFDLSESSNVQIRVLNVLGQLMRDINAGDLNAGTHAIEIERADLPVGNYIVSVIAGKDVKSQQLVVGQ